MDPFHIQQIFYEALLKKHKSKIIILTGKAQSGKSLTANIIKKNLEKQNKKTVIISYAKYLKDYAKEITNWNGNEKTKPREFLQQIGVELIKNQIDENMLINRIKEDIKVYEYFFDVIIISDARFKSEIENIKNKNTVVIKIEGKQEKQNEPEDTKQRDSDNKEPAKVIAPIR